MEGFSLSSFYHAIYDLLLLFQQDSFPCRCCPYCHEEEFRFEKVRFVPISPYGSCNSSCIYCDACAGDAQGYDPVPYLEMFEKAGLFDGETFFDWGGGEPTLSPHFGQTVRYLAELGHRQRINTNAIIFSEETYEAIRAGKASARISVDSGSEAGFLRVKGNRHFEDVWRNIAKYCEASGEVYIKYNVCNYNSDVEEIDAFLSRCGEAGVRHILVDAEMSSYQKIENAGPFYFTAKEFEAAHYLYKQALRLDFQTEVNYGAFSARAEYDMHHKLCLPSQYFDNIDHAAITNNVYVEAFATAEAMLTAIRRSDMPPVIFGAGLKGRMLARILDTEEIDYRVIDNNEQLLGHTIGNAHFVESARVFLAGKTGAIFIVASDYVDEMLEQINRAAIPCRAFWAAYSKYYNYLARRGLAVGEADEGDGHEGSEDYRALSSAVPSHPGK